MLIAHAAVATLRREYERACELLEQITLTPETEAMWSHLSRVATAEGRMTIAERCYAALGLPGGCVWKQSGVSAEGLGVHMKTRATPRSPKDLCPERKRTQSKGPGDRG